MMAWRAAGVYLSLHRCPVGRDRAGGHQLQPGDLLPRARPATTWAARGWADGSRRPYTGAHVAEASIYRSDLLPYGGRVR